MAFTIYVPNINPLNFTQENYATPPQYNSKHVHDFQFEETIRPWQQFTRWYQQWQRNDAIRIQLHSSIGPVEMTIYDIDDVPVYSASFQQMQQSYFDPNLYIWQLDLALNIFDEGFYRMRIAFGSPETVVLFSNPFELREVLDNSLLIEYRHYKHYADAYFENGWNPSIRITGSLVYQKPASANVVYENQASDMTLVNTKPFDTWKLYTGGPEGIPDWAILKYNLIVGCSNLKIDGRYYTKASDGANFEEKETPDYPMRGWSIELRDKLNRSSKIWTVGGIGPGQNNLGLTVVVNVETKGFVNDDVGGSYYEVQDVE